MVTMLQPPTARTPEQLRALLKDDTAGEKELRSILRGAFDPGDRVTVDEWAERNIVLTSRMTRFSGPLRIDRTPYIRGPLRALTLSRYEAVLLAWAGQLAKSTVEQIWMSYVVDQDPGPCMLAFPDQNMAKRRSRGHLKPMIAANPVLQRRVVPKLDAVQNFQVQFDRMTVNLAWAGSPSAIASEPVRFLIRDEIEKWKHKDKSEGHPLELSEVRVASYGDLAKILDASTPGLEDGVVIPRLKAGTYHEFFVPCPKCGKHEQLEDLPCLVTEQSQEELKPRLVAAGYQVLRWEHITGWGDERDPDKVAELAVYECEHCKHRFRHSEVIRITQHGKWIPRNPQRSRATFQLARWYRDLPSCSFGAAARAFYKAKDNPVDLQSWVNNWKAEGYRQAGAEVKGDVVRSHCRAYKVDTIPFVPLFVFATVDIRNTEIHYVIRAHGEHCKTAQLRKDILPRLWRPKEGEPNTGESLSVLDPIRELTFQAADGRAYGIDLMGIDSGWEPAEVYEYCRTRPRCAALKGENNMKDVIAYSQPLKEASTGKPAADSPWLISFSAEYFKDLLLIARMKTTAGAPNDWMLPETIDDGYVEHMTSERKVIEKDKYGRLRAHWKKFNPLNHFLDCENMQEALQHFAGVRDLRLPEGTPQPEAPKVSGLMGRDMSGFMRRMHAM
jgi:phage terminase large subunit GpA-like protein